MLNCSGNLELVDCRVLPKVQIWLLFSYFFLDKEFMH